MPDNVGSRYVCPLRWRPLSAKVLRQEAAFAVRLRVNSNIHHHPEKRSVQEYESLKQLVEECAEDIRKAEGGNKAAGTRVRKQMQQIKSTAQDIRNKVLELRGPEDS